MVIQWFGQSCFKIQAKPGPGQEVTVIFDPFDPKRVGLKLPKLVGDIVVVTHDHFDHNYTEGVTGQPFLINGPGEYEFKGAFLYGLPAWHDDQEGRERGAITMCFLEVEGLSVAHLGDLGQSELTSQQMELLEGVDILLLPVGGNYTIDGKKAASIVNQIEPRIIIPMHYKLPGLKVEIEGVDKFVKEVGFKPSTMDKLKIVKKDLPQEDSQLILLTV
ncbi:MBL fold metallo-hydrolase [Patescibacteria group bacterium]|nr:MBL fold metallo-hydrolase [Patescibacteria group bacterium]